MKKLFNFLFLAATVVSAALVLSSCGDDEEVVEMPQKSNIKFVVDNISDDMHAFYDITITYRDLSGTLHKETVDGRSWKYSESNGAADAPIYLLIEANLRTTEVAHEKESYELSYHYSFNYYKPATKAVSENPTVWKKTLSRDALTEYLADPKNAHILIKSVSR